MTPLYIIGTPIGTLKQLPEYSQNQLKQCEYILCEDTRRTRILCQYFGINTPLRSFYSVNEARQIPKILLDLKDNKNIALVSDSGMPTISDPGTKLIDQIHQNNLKIQAIPGPSAITTALSCSGFSTSQFVFEGFLPKKRHRQTRLKQIANEKRTVIIFESPHRLIRLFDELLTLCDEKRMVYVGRELTKLYEEHIRGTLADITKLLHEKQTIRGEFTIVLNKITTHNEKSQTHV